MNQETIILAIETAVGGGSVALLRGDSALDCRIGIGSVSRSEDVLALIGEILENSEIEKSEIEKVVVSRGPGSYTGVRIGAAIGLGLQTALGCRLISISVFEAMRQFENFDRIESGGELIAAIPYGANQVCRQIFRPDEAGTTLHQSVRRVSSFSDFRRFLDGGGGSGKPTRALLHQKIYQELISESADWATETENFVNVGENIALLAGRAARNLNYNKFLEPIYVGDDYAK